MQAILRNIWTSEAFPGLPAGRKNINGSGKHSAYRSRRMVDEGGKFNRAIKNFVFAGLQPDDLPALKAAFERLWPRATCTALGLANNLPLLMGTAEGMGWQFQPAEATP